MKNLAYYHNKGYYLQFEEAKLLAFQPIDTLFPCSDSKEIWWLD